MGGFVLLILPCQPSLYEMILITFDVLACFPIVLYKTIIFWEWLVLLYFSRWLISKQIQVFFDLSSWKKCRFVDMWYVLIVWTCFDILSIFIDSFLLFDTEDVMSKSVGFFRWICLGLHTFFQLGVSKSWVLHGVTELCFLNVQKNKWKWTTENCQDPTWKGAQKMMNNPEKFLQNLKGRFMRRKISWWFRNVEFWPSLCQIKICAGYYCII